MDETRKQLLEAQSVEEVAQILKEAGDIEAKAEKVWEGICDVREKEGKNLSLDELDAVAGGFFLTERDWGKDGCAATVEPGSSCLGTDGGCSAMNISYSHAPNDRPCIFCGAKYTFIFSYFMHSDSTDYYYECRDCGKRFYYNKVKKQWEDFGHYW